MAASTASRASGNGIRVRIRMRRKSLHSRGSGGWRPFVLCFGFGFFLGLLPAEVHVSRRRRIRAVIGRDFNHFCGLFAGILGFVWKFSVLRRARRLEEIFDGAFVAAAHAPLVAVHEAHVPAEVSGCVLRLVVQGLELRVFALLCHFHIEEGRFR